MSEKIWTLLRTYCLESTLIGLKYFYIYPDFLSRCFWTVNLVTMVAFSCMITWLLYSRFEAMPTRVTIENQFESVFNLPHPTVTLCSPNQMTKSSARYFNRSLVDRGGNLTIDLEYTMPLLLGFYEHVEVDGDELEQLQQLLELNRYGITEVMGKMPQSCDRFLKRCFLEGHVIDCQTIFKPILTSHGYCCTFNSKYEFDGKSVKLAKNFLNHSVRSIGFLSSLSVVLDYEPEDAIPDTLLNAGSIRVMLTDWTEYPVNYEMFLVDSNGEAYVFLSATYTYCSDEVRTLPAWSRECYFEEEVSLAFFKQYRNSDCDHLCYLLAVWKTCGCWLFFLPHLKHQQICQPTQIPCISEVKRNMSAWLTTDQCDCPRDCVSRRYRADLTVGNFDGLPHLVDSQNPFKDMKLNMSSSIINFLFTNPVYVKQKQETVMSIISLVSSLGGVFGLFMGCSGISVLEILFYVYKGTRQYVRDRRVPQHPMTVEIQYIHDDF